MKNKTKFRRAFILKMFKNSQLTELQPDLTLGVRQRPKSESVFQKMVPGL